MLKLYAYKNGYYFCYTWHICTILRSTRFSFGKTIHYSWHHRVTYNIRVHRSNNASTHCHTQPWKMMVVIIIDQPNRNHSSHLASAHFSSFSTLISNPLQLLNNVLKFSLSFSFVIFERIVTVDFLRTVSCFFLVLSCCVVATIWQIF